MDARAIAFAVPLFFLLIGIEFVVSRRRGQANYRYHDAVASLSCGIGQQALGFFFKLFSIGIYAALYEHARMFTIPEDSIIAWVVLLFGVDLAYYWYHRASHRINFFWATHIVHHQSEEYNLSTALRQSWFTALTSWLFYAPLAVVGFSPFMFVLMTTLNTLYQFWIHTRTVGKLGPLEWVLNTPSHHRVHHGIDPEYVDKNYAGIFILWDRWFGTFIEEKREPVYGTVKKLDSFNAIWANFEPLARMVAMSVKTKRWGDKIRVWTHPPEWFPSDLGGPVTVPDVDHVHHRKYDRKTTLSIDAYVAVNFVAVTIGLTTMLWFSGELEMGPTVVGVALVMMTVIAWGGLFEGRGWAPWVECIKLTTLAVSSVWIFELGVALSIAIGALALLLAAWVVKLRRGPTERVQVPLTTTSP